MKASVLIRALELVDLSLSILSALETLHSSTILTALIMLIVVYYCSSK